MQRRSRYRSRYRPRHRRRRITEAHWRSVERWVWSWNTVVAALIALALPPAWQWLAMAAAIVSFGQIRHIDGLNDQPRRRRSRTT